jgi:secreted Zn-dependent insulinase-like peptidase
VINYIKAKKASQLENYRQQFLVSLLPDVEEMDARQFRKFRKRVSDLIEEILEPNSSSPQTSATPTTWTNESSASSFGINI